MKRPNILWYCSDQQRFDTIRALGNPNVHTPRLDGLVAKGVAFTQAYCQSPICTPSRASFLTGVYPSALGVNGNGFERFPAEHAHKLLPNRLARAGYDCGLVGKLHLAWPLVVVAVLEVAVTVLDPRLLPRGRAREMQLAD